MILIALMVKLTSKGRALCWSDRIGKDNTVFKMPKFRTMRQGTPAIATHLLNPDRYVTPIGKILRKLNIDEHPQLYSIRKAYMSFVRPRPPLFK